MFTNYNDNPFNQIQLLEELFDRKLIHKSEYEQRKGQIVDRITNTTYDTRQDTDNNAPNRQQVLSLQEKSADASTGHRLSKPADPSGNFHFLPADFTTVGPTHPVHSHFGYMGPYSQSSTPNSNGPDPKRENNAPNSTEPLPGFQNVYGPSMHYSTVTHQSYSPSSMLAAAANAARANAYQQSAPSSQQQQFRHDVSSSTAFGVPMSHQYPDGMPYGSHTVSLTSQIYGHQDMSQQFVSACSKFRRFFVNRKHFSGHRCPKPF
jgi:hypothetical protein